MTVYLEFLLLGVGSGVIIGALAIGLVIGYRASGVINFAHGAVAGYVAYVYASLVRDGTYPIPPIPNPLAVLAGIAGWFGIELSAPDIPTFIDLGGPTGVPWAVAIAMATAVLIGLIAHVLVFKPLRFAPATAKVVASVAFLLVLQSVVVLRFGARPVRVENLLPSERVDLLGIGIPRDRFILLAILLVVTLALWALYKFTRFGIATRAAAENEQVATLLGVSADRQARTGWVLSAVVAGGVGILVVPITGLTPDRMTILVIPAIAAALVGAFSSFWAAALVGLAIGMAQSVVFLLEQEQSWVPDDLNLPQVLPLLVIAVAMTVRGNVIPGRGAIEAERLPFAYAARVNPWWVVFGVGLAAAAVIYLPFDYRNGLTNSMIGVLLALSLVVVTGFVGQVSLAQVSLSGVAAFGLGSFMTQGDLPFPVALVLAVAATAALGALIGLLSIRTRGPSLAIVTLAAGIAIEAVLLNRDGWFGTGSLKETGVPSILGWEFGPGSDFFLGDDKIPSPALGLFLLALTTVACLLVAALRRSRLGEQMLAVRSNERAASAAGVNVGQVKLVAFTISATLAGTAGAMKAVELGTYRPATFAFFGSLVLLAVAYLGGISSVTGALWTGTLVAGGIGVVAGEEFIALGRYEAYVAGILLLAELAADADGIAASQRKLNAWVMRKVRGVRRDSPQIADDPLAERAPVGEAVPT